MKQMEYLRPRLPEKEIELCLDVFDKKEAKRRILTYVKGVLDDAESQFKLFSIHSVVGQSEQLKAQQEAYEGYNDGAMNAATEILNG